MNNNDNNDIIVLFEQIKDVPYQIIRNVVWNKDQFAGTMMKYIIFGVVYNENISATYILPDGKVELSGVILEYGNLSQYL